MKNISSIGFLIKESNKPKLSEVFKKIREAFYYFNTLPMGESKTWDGWFNFINNYVNITWISEDLIVMLHQKMAVLVESKTDREQLVKTKNVVVSDDFLDHTAEHFSEGYEEWGS